MQPPVVLQCTKPLSRAPHGSRGTSNSSHAHEPESQEAESHESEPCSPPSFEAADTYMWHAEPLSQIRGRGWASLQAAVARHAAEHASTYALGL